jgi:hypothetical protein
MVMVKHEYDWTVVGGGATGIGIVGLLLDNGVNPRKLLWVDPEFKVGDLGTKWGNVWSNTKGVRFNEFLNGSPSFGYGNIKTDFAFRGVGQDDTCLIKTFTEPLQAITTNLREKVVTMESGVMSLRFGESSWNVDLKHGEITSRSVAMALGSVAKVLDYKKPIIELETALDMEKIQKSVKRDEVIGVFGSSHTAAALMHNFVESGYQVINFYRSPLRDAQQMDGWIKYDNIGLKGKYAEWAKVNLSGERCPENLLRVESNANNIARYLPECSKVVYGIGFVPRTVPIEGVKVTGYDEKTGLIAPGLYGCGISHPPRLRYPDGSEEYGIGVAKVMKQLRQEVPDWIAESKKPRVKMLSMS